MSAEPVVEVGQVWEDLDKGRHRVVVVVDIAGRHAGARRVEGGRKNYVFIPRMLGTHGHRAAFRFRPSSTGCRLVSP